jgi:FkbM family methyltransferase
MRGVCTVLVKIGLRGLGVKIDHNPGAGGESWFLKKVLPILRNPVCMDVGANIGEYALLCRKYGASRVLAFEPVPEIFNRLAENTASDPRIKCMQTAVGEYSGTTSIFIPDDPGLSLLGSRDITITEVADRDNKKMTVGLITLDDFINHCGVQVDLVKIDVEGFEIEVLRGAARMLADMRPVVQFEFNSHHMYRRQNLTDFSDILCGYSLYRLSRASLHPLDPRDYLANLFAYQNIVAIPTEKQSIRELFR